jgi:hypothetical protein
LPDDERVPLDEELGGGLEGRDDGGCERGLTVGRELVEVGGATRVEVGGALGATRPPEGGLGTTTRDGGRDS